MEIISNKSYKIQVLRGLAIIAVVFIHNTPDGLAQVLCRPFLNFSVGLFLFLSGMLSDVSKWNPKKRIVKVLIPYAIWTLIYVILSNVNTLSAIPMSYVINLLTGKGAAIMYYIFIYCEFTLLIPIIDKLARSRYKWIGFVIAPAEIVIMRSIPLVFGIEIPILLSTIRSISCLGWFTYFYLGYLLGNNMIQLKISMQKLIIFLGGYSPTNIRRILVLFFRCQ